jgi:hypothetical protein
LRGVISSHPRVFCGKIINYLFTPISPGGGQLEPPTTGFFTKIIKKQSKLLFSKNMSEVKKILNVILVDNIIFLGKIYFSFF